MLKHLMFLASFIAGIVGFSAAIAEDPDPDVFYLDIQFTVGTEHYGPLMERRMDALIDMQIDLAETVFGGVPRLEITKSVVRETRAGGQNLSNLQFDNIKKYHTFMDENFDTIVRSKTSGTFQVLVVDRLCVGEGKDSSGNIVYGCFDGAAFLPRSASPFANNKKHGLIITAFSMEDGFLDASDPTAGLEEEGDWMLAHELGHMFSLRHTFSSYGNIKKSLDCNMDFPKASGDDGHCNSCAGVVSVRGGNTTCDGPVNLMDYCAGAPSPDLNSCQETRAAKQRKKYMTAKGWTDYFQIKGNTGTKACKKDRNCNENTHFCDKGTLSMGKNVCKLKKVNYKACTRKAQCASGKCRAGKCRP